jgi:hypothetical protein
MRTLIGRIAWWLAYKFIDLAAWADKNEPLTSVVSAYDTSASISTGLDPLFADAVSAAAVSTRVYAGYAGCLTPGPCSCCGTEIKTKKAKKKSKKKTKKKSKK